MNAYPRETSTPSAKLARARSYLSKLPPSIQGSDGSGALILAAYRTVEFGLGFEEALELLHEFNTRCQPPWSEKELRHKLNDGFKKTKPIPTFTDGFSALTVPLRPVKPPLPRWPHPDSDRISQILESGNGLADLWEKSPVRLDSNDNRTEEIIDGLFPSGALLCCGRTLKMPETQPREAFRGRLSGMQFIVPSTMSNRTGATLQGNESARCLDNVGTRQFLVIEFDFKELNSNGEETWCSGLVRQWRSEGRSVQDACAGLLLYLSTRYAPLSLAVHSGGKSIHGWFRCSGEPAEKIAKFFAHAVALGADSMLWTPCQFTRMPDGTRDDGNRQTVFFFNPTTIRHE